MTLSIVSFIVVLVLLTASGAMAWIRKKKTTEDYLVASRGVKPWLSALSTVATNNSGFMFIGMIGYSYRYGIESLWLAFGWVVGDLISWSFVHPRVRHASATTRANTLTALIGTWEDTVKRPIIVGGGLITLVFLGVYAAAQLKAGSTALHALFEWPEYVGVLIGTGIVILYSYAGGIRADIWTDAAQSFAMMGTMVMLLIAGWLEIGGLGALLSNLENQDPSLVQWTPEGAQFGLLAFILGYLFAGLGTVGQPHLMTRLMSIESVPAVKRARVWYFLYYGPFFLASIGVGLYCRAILPDLAQMSIAQEVSNPTELALPLLTMELLPEIIIGIALAGLFAATVSTADSQIIVCSGAITQEMRPRWKESYKASKLATFGVTALALAIALLAPEGVFGLVIIAWSAMGASLGPVLVLRLFNMPLPSSTALAMMVVALTVVTLWHFSGYDDALLKIVPGTLAAFLVYGIAWLLMRYTAYGGRPEQLSSEQAGG